MQVELTERKYHLIGLTPILGSQPADEFIHTRYIESKAPSPMQAAQEAKMLEIDEDSDESNITVFYRRAESDDALCLLDYMVMGFFKEAVLSMEAQNSVKLARTKVDRYLFVQPREIPLLRNGRPILEEDDVLERPLRTIMTGKGQVNMLRSSERVDDPWEVFITVQLLKNNATRKSEALTWDAIEGALNYGKLRGLGQWRNGGYGRFKWERVDEEAGA